MNGRYRTRKGGRIDRGTPIHFTFDGLNYDGVAGDTLASALLANGVHFLGRSFKYHRPRGIMTAGAEEPNALVTVSRGRGRTTPNLRATQIELYDGLEAESQNRWPSLRLDIGAINTSFSSLLSAGFYYKTFMGPRALGNWAWTRIFEPVIRRAAGLGEPPLYSDRDRYAQFYDHCDVLIIGAGPAGLAAALSAGESGARVIICDEQSEPGGSMLAERTARIDDMAALVWRDTTLIQLAAMPNVRMMPRTQAFGYY
ncbi:MAG: 2Fe-2S iron-sulfur cluster-binding protein, partial [Beijerinckiaceae bacterium]